MAYFWDNSITAEFTEDFCSQVFIKMFITTITTVVELCTHFLERKKGCGTGKKMCLETLFPECHRKGEGWSDGLRASPNLCPQMQGWQPGKHWRALSRMKPSSPPHSLSRATRLLSASSWLQKLHYLFTTSHVSYGEPSHPKNTKVIG